MVHGFTKITPINGFDAINPDNARQNNYAWSMAEMGDYIYVGTGRNIFYNVFKGISQSIGIEINFPDILIPKNYDNSAEIWRYKRDGSEGWKRVFKAQEGIEGFRFMIRYTTPGGETAIYAGVSIGYSMDDEADAEEVAFYPGGYSIKQNISNEEPKVKIFKSTNGYDWEELRSDIPGTSTRSMVVHNGKLYMSVLNELSSDFGTRIYVSEDPEYEGWELVTSQGDRNTNPNDGVVIMESFNNHLYAGTGQDEGFELWRTIGVHPEQNRWVRVIDKGAGDALNQGPLTLGVFKNHLYVGAIYSPFDVNLRYGSFKPFDLIRIDKNDNWELVVGGSPFEPTNPETGVRGQALSGLPSGFGNPFNLYCWQLQEHNGEFYLGTFDWLVLVVPMLLANLSLITEDTSMGNLLQEILDYIPAQFLNYIINPPFSIFRGFDLFKSSDGVRWVPVTINGLDNPYNYGVRNIFSSEDGHLYLGTANVFEGLEVWKK
ncbi:hypothetical protein [Tissierella creatinophila]|uniref:Uncharacterized protein n=1 Tax=Tissierella creatinophila DSM 6911 TaxID=1123403 RepID=A0A1U7M5P9_TISCR|nr:hypothetical protein [Tissierella creatinophila]OLS02611.1 hypothetical protein TICRE_14120 [Tissierella creatinophila DSM 6911]